jgi:flavin-binding protein dodecin
MNIYKGTSRNGLLDEAIVEAIAAAKDAIPTDYIEWKLIEVSGVNGGFTQVNELSATLEITSTAP